RQALARAGAAPDRRPRPLHLHRPAHLHPPPQCSSLPLHAAFSPAGGGPDGLPPRPRPPGPVGPPPLYLEEHPLRHRSLHPRPPPAPLCPAPSPSCRAPAADLTTIP